VTRKPVSFAPVATACDNVSMRAMAPVLAAILTLAACGGSSSSSGGAAEPAPAPAASEESGAAPTPSGAPLEQDLPTLVARAVEMFEAMGTALSAGGDCPSQAAKLRELQGKFQPVIEAARKVETDGRGAEVEKLLVPHEDRLKAAVEKMQPTVQACMTDPDFERAFTELTGS
jgi:hypothetical protein